MAVTSAFASAIGDVIGRRDEDLYRQQASQQAQQTYQLRADDLAFRKDQASEQRRTRDEEAGKIAGRYGREFERSSEGYEGLLEWEGDVGRAGRALPPPTLTERAGEAQDIYEQTGMQVPGFGYPEERSPTSWETGSGETPGDRVRRLQGAYGMPYGEISRFRERSRLTGARQELGMDEYEIADIEEEDRIRRQVRAGAGRP